MSRTPDSFEMEPVLEPDDAYTATPDDLGVGPDGAEPIPPEPTFE